jgi:hypothetical protein
MNTLPLQSARGVTVVVRGGSPTPPPSPKAELSPTLPQEPIHAMMHAKRARRNFFKRLAQRKGRGNGRTVPMTSPPGGWPSDRAKVEAFCDHYGVAAEMRARLLARIDAISAEIDLLFDEARAFLANEHSDEVYRAWAIGYGAIPMEPPRYTASIKTVFKTKVFVNIYDHIALCKAGAFEPQMRMVSTGPAGGDGDDDVPMLVHVPSTTAIRHNFPNVRELREYTVKTGQVFPLGKAKSAETTKIFLKFFGFGQ